MQVDKYVVAILFLWTEIIVAFFILQGTIQFQDCLIIRNYFNTEEAQSFVISIEISLWPWVLFWANNLIIFTISLTQNSKEKDCLKFQNLYFQERCCFKMYEYTVY